MTAESLLNSDIYAAFKYYLVKYSLTLLWSEQNT